MDRAYVIHSSKIIRSFRTDRPRAVVDKIEGVVTLEATVEEAVNLIFDEGLADVMILNGETGQVLAFMSNPQTSTLLMGRKKKERKEQINLDLQAQCHRECQQVCAERGGCFSHALTSSGICCINCDDGRGETLGQMLDTLITSMG